MRSMRNSRINHKFRVTEKMRVERYRKSEKGREREKESKKISHHWNSSKRRCSEELCRATRIYTYTVHTCVGRSAMPYREDWLAVTRFCLYSASIVLSSLPLRSRIARHVIERMNARRREVQPEKLHGERRVYV